MADRRSSNPRPRGGAMQRQQQQQQPRAVGAPQQHAGGRGSGRLMGPAVAGGWSSGAQRFGPVPAAPQQQQAGVLQGGWLAAAPGAAAAPPAVMQPQQPQQPPPPPPRRPGAVAANSSSAVAAGSVVWVAQQQPAHAALPHPLAPQPVLLQQPAPPPGVQLLGMPMALAGAPTAVLAPAAPPGPVAAAPRPMRSQRQLQQQRQQQRQQQQHQQPSSAIASALVALRPAAAGQPGAMAVLQRPLPVAALFQAPQPPPAPLVPAPRPLLQQPPMPAILQGVPLPAVVSGPPSWQQPQPQQLQLQQPPPPPQQQQLAQHHASLLQQPHIYQQQPRQQQQQQQLQHAPPPPPPPPGDPAHGSQAATTFDLRGPGSNAPAAAATIDLRGAASRQQPQQPSSLQAANGHQQHQQQQQQQQQQHKDQQHQHQQYQQQQQQQQQLMLGSKRGRGWSPGADAAQPAAARARLNGAGLPAPGGNGSSSGSEQPAAGQQVLGLPALAALQQQLGTGPGSWGRGGGHSVATSMQLAAPTLLPSQQQQQQQQQVLPSLASLVTAAQAAALPGLSAGMPGVLQLAAGGVLPASLPASQQQLFGGLGSGIGDGTAQRLLAGALASGLAAPPLRLPSATEALLAAIATAQQQQQQQQQMQQQMQQQQQQLQQQQALDLAAQIAAASTPAAVLAAASERGMGLRTDQLCACLQRLGQLAAAGSAVDTSGQALQDLLGLCRSRMGSMAPQQLAELVCALGQLSLVPDASFMGALASHCLERLPRFTASQIGDMLAGFAALECIPGTPLLEAAARSLLVGLHGLAPQQAASAMWAFARMEYRPPHALLEQALQVLAASLALLPPDWLSRVAWAYAAFGHAPPPEQLAALVQRAEACCSSLAPDALAALLLALQALGAQLGGSRLLDAAADAALAQLSSFSVAVLDDLLKVYAAAKHHPGVALLHGAAQHIASQLQPPAGADGQQQLPPTTIISLLQSYATLGYAPPKALLALLSQQLLGQLTAVEPCQLAAALWCFALFRDLRPELWNAAAALLAQLSTAGALPPAAMPQLCQAHTLVTKSPGEGGSAGRLSSPPQLVAATWQAHKQANEVAAASALPELVLQVSCCLSALGVRHTHNLVSEDGLCLLRLALPDRRLAVEVLEPACFCCNQQQPLGGTVMRIQLLRACGWQPVVVPHYEWQPLGGEPGAQQRYLHGLLAAHSEVAPPLLAA